MKTFLLISLLTFLVVSVESYCPSGCSGRGSCGPYDTCTCYTDIFGNAQFTGPDCSLYVCPTGDAWVLNGATTTNARGSVECSNKGLCDRANGECQCFEGYEGKACERTTCPNNCNARGQCLSQELLATMGGGTYATAWDHDKVWGCKCDLGYTGVDCSLRQCPSAADPLGGSGASVGRVCASRGKCNLQTGTCECYPGYTGQACTVQTTVR